MNEHDQNAANPPVESEETPTADETQQQPDGNQQDSPADEPTSPDDQESSPKEDPERKAAIDEAFKGINDSINKIAEDLEGQFGEEHEAMMRAIGRGILRNFPDGNAPDVSVLGFEMGPNGIRPVTPDQMPPCVRDMIDRVIGRQQRAFSDDDTTETQPQDEPDDTDDDGDDNTSGEELIHSLMGLLASIIKNGRPPSEELESQFGTISAAPDLRYFERYMKQWVKKTIKREMKYLTKAIKKTRKKDWKDTCRLMEKTNRKVRQDLGGQMNATYQKAGEIAQQNARQAVQRHVSQEHNQSKLQQVVKDAQAASAAANGSNFKLINEGE